MFKYLFTFLLFLSVAGFVYTQDMNQATMDTKYKTMYKEVLSALTSGNLDVLEKYISPNFIEHDPSPVMSEKTGLERIKEDFTAYHKIFPDMKAEVHNIAVSGDMLFAYLTFTGTTSEPAMGMPANHKMTMNAIDLIRFEGDKAVEHWGFTANSDIMNMMPQGKPMNEGMDKK